MGFSVGSAKVLFITGTHANAITAMHTIVANGGEHHSRLANKFLMDKAVYGPQCQTSDASDGCGADRSALRRPAQALKRSHHSLLAFSRRTDQKFANTIAKRVAIREKQQL